jgi:hypothetical protein
MKKIVFHYPSFFLFSICLTVFLFGVYLENRIVLIYADASPIRIIPNREIDSNQWQSDNPILEEFKFEFKCF